MLRPLPMLIALAIAGTAHAGDLVPIQHFARKPDLLSAKISPTGEHLAVQLRANEQIGVGVIDLKTMKITGVISFGHQNLPWRYHWSGPTSVVAEVARSFGPLDQPRLTGELYGMNADGSNKRYLFGYAGTSNIGSRLKRGAGIDHASAFVIDPMPENPLHMTLMVIPWQAKSLYDMLPFVDVIDLIDLNRRRKGTLPYHGADVLTDTSGEPRFVTGTDNEGRCCFMSMRMPTDKTWTPVDMPGGRSPFVELEGLDRKGESAFLTAASADGATCLLEFRFATRDFTRLACEGVEPAVQLSVDERRPVVLRYEDGLPRMVYPDPAHADARIVRSLENSFKGQRVSSISRSTDGNKLVVLVDSDRSPGDFYLVDRAAKKVDYLMGRSKWIDPGRMVATEPVRIPVRDGATVPGYLTGTGGLKARQMPLVVVPHGGPHGVRDYWQWDPDVQLLASRGYTVLQVNYRGSGGYGLAWESAGYRKWGTLMQDDIADAVKWTVSQGVADPSRICIYGASYGAYAALMNATREPELYRCAVGLAGVYDLAELVDDTDVVNSWLGRVYVDLYLGSDMARLREQSPVTHVARLKAHVMIAHGAEDKRAPISQAKLLRRALEKAGKPYEWAEYAGEEHGFHKEANQVDFYSKLLAFLDKHIGAGPKQQ